MAIPNYLYSYLLIITCVVLLQAHSRANDDNTAAIGSLLGGKKWIKEVPKKTVDGFVQLVDLQLNSTNKTQVVKATGYSIDVFYAVISFLERLHYNISFEFRAFVDENGNSSGDYDALIYQIYEGKYDAVVGDWAIVANRSNYVDFTLPYKPGVLMMLVKARRDPRLNMWIIVQPFTWNLWLCIIIFSIFIGVIIVLMVRYVVDEDSTPTNSPSRRQLSWTSILWLPIMQAVLPERERVSKAWPTLVLVLWLILVFVLMQSYTACLSSILTVHKLQPTYPSENDVIKDPNINIGYPGVSFLKGLFVDRLKIDSWRLKNLSGVEEYKEGLDKGSRQGGVDAIFNEVSSLRSSSINMVLIIIMPW